MDLWYQSRVEGTSLAKIKGLLTEYIGLDPRFGEAHLQLGILYFEEQDYATAVHEYERAIALNPLLDETHFRLAHALMRLGKATPLSTNDPYVFV